MRYLRLFGLTVILGFMLAWAWVAAMPMAFMDPEYASWRAKQMMLDRCDLGDAIIVGDSRAAADIIPARLPLHFTNLAVGGGEPIEAVSALDRALACPTPPKLVIISLDPGHFTRPDLFWQRSVRFGFMTAPDITALRAASVRTGDFSVYEAVRLTGVPAIVRDWLYEARFPPLYFATLTHGGLLLRWTRNHRMLSETLSDRGHYFFGTNGGSSTVAVDGHMDEFRPSPILDDYFERLLRTLGARKIEARFIAMPVNEATWREVRPALRDQFAAYLAGYERRYPRFRVVSEIMPHWPDRFFGDQFCHLNPEGAERFSDAIAQLLGGKSVAWRHEPRNSQSDALRLGVDATQTGRRAVE